MPFLQLVMNKTAVIHLSSVIGESSKIVPTLTVNCFLRPDIHLKFYAHVLDGSADAAAEVLSGPLDGGLFSAKAAQTAAV